jgi:hypothetical protein
MRMKKILIFSSAMFIIVFLASSFITPIKATNLGMQYGHLAPPYDTLEEETEEGVCQEIYNKFYYDYYTSCEPIDAYWYYTSATSVGQCLDWQRSYSDYVTNWWVGDFHADPGPTPSPHPYGHLWFYGNNYDDISDDFVHDHVTNNGYATSKEYFDFIWTCANGGRYWTDNYGNHIDVTGIKLPASTWFYPPPDNDNTEYGFWDPWNTNYGMPFAWTGNLDMDLDGYNNNQGSYCYIGWEGPSPFMLQYSDFLGRYFYEFPLDFYDKALGYMDSGYHQTIHDSLDYASLNFFGFDFDEVFFYYGYWSPVYVPGDTYWFFVHMRVLGNSYLTIN